MPTPEDEGTALLHAIRAHRPRLAEGGFAADRDNADPTGNLALLAELGTARLVVPAAHGGLWDGTERGGWGTLIRAVREISAGDGPTGQNWLTTALVARELFGPGNGLPRGTREELAHRVLHDGLRFVSSVAETGTTGTVTARRVDGGVLVTGTKTFNSNSGGGGAALVRCLLDGAPHQALVDLDDPRIEAHDDWDNMGQRGTRSRTLTYRDVFAPDGHHRPAPATPSPVFLGAVMLLHAALLQGIGEGALDALLGHARTMTRGSLPRFSGPADDPLVLRRIGATSSRLAASRALLHTAADRLETGAEDTDETTVDCFRAKVAAVEASLETAAEIHEITGARSTSHAHRYDRFWRNARTFASHDPVDAKNVYIGRHELTGTVAEPSSVIRF
ncbi:acyl-CoA dehydrogenase family protein [Saccharopolyspora gregorii]|uniref:acyl-CoA dehydrogenase family protein n=1 Tax=Saccharopolyspora gregorii TaxID=33914 RepID=UPI0021AC7CB9|nr:acyl-CoA dehydrogenase family protein [Saccharopolyspora gregorii]